MSQYPWTLLAVYVVTTGRVQLLALWAAYSRGPWLLRALVVWTPIALLATIRAYEPALLLLMSAALTIGICLTIERYWPRVPSDKPRPPLWRFRLADLLVVMLFVATWLALMGRGGGTILAHLIAPFIVALVALPLALLTILSSNAVVGRRRWTMAILALGVVWLSAVLLRVFRSPLYLSSGPSALSHSELENEFFWLGIHAAVFTGAVISLSVAVMGAGSAVGSSRGDWLRTVSIVIGALAIAVFIPMAWLAWELFWVVSLATWSNRIVEVTIHSIYFVATAGMIAGAKWLTRFRRDASSAFRRRTARATSLILLSLVAVAFAWIYWQMLWYAPYPKIDHGSENHYEEVTKIAKYMRQFDGSNLPLPAPAQAKVDEAVVLLHSPNYMPLKYLDAPFWGTEAENLLNGNDVRSLSWQFQRAAATAIGTGNHDRAADYAVAIIRLDAIFTQGNHPYCAHSGYQLLAQTRDKISPLKAREVIEVLDRTLDERYTPEQIAAWSHAHAERTSGWSQRLRSVLAGRGFDPIDYSSAIAIVIDLRKFPDSTIGLLEADLAVRAHHQERGDVPEQA